MKFVMKHSSLHGKENKKKHPKEQTNKKWRFSGDYFDSRMVNGKTRYYCPIGSVMPNKKCQASISSKFKGWLRIGSLHLHIQQHCKSNQYHVIPRQYWKKYSKKYCPQCKVVYSRSSRKHINHVGIIVDDHKEVLDNMEEYKDEHKEIFEKKNDGIIFYNVDDNLPSFDEIWEYNLPCEFVIPGSLINDWASIVEKKFWTI